MTTVTVTCWLRPGENPDQVVARLKRVDAYDPAIRKPIKTKHHEGYRLSPSSDPQWLGRVAWEADIP